MNVDGCKSREWLEESMDGLLKRGYDWGGSKQWTKEWYSRIKVASTLDMFKKRLTTVWSIYIKYDKFVNNYFKQFFSTLEKFKIISLNHTVHSCHNLNVLSHSEDRIFKVKCEI